MPNHPVQMNPSRQFCPNVDCTARGKIGHGNIVVHSKARPRYRCKRCGKTFSGSQGTMLAGLRKPSDVIVIVITLLAYGCPLQAIVHAYGLDERTVARWRERAGNHCKQVHQALLAQGHLDVIHVQADEIRVKGRKMIAWMGLALMVSTRLWVAGTISLSRDRALADRLLRQVRACTQSMRAVLICTDGWAAYPSSIQRAFREKVKATARRGRARFQVWPELCIATIIKRTQKKRVIAITRKMTLGTREQASILLHASSGGAVLNTAFIERFNGTMRERLASLTRCCRHAAGRLETLEAGMYLIGCPSNFCWPHQELSKPHHAGQACTPAMASGVRDHVWSVRDLLESRLALAPWVEPRRRGRPRSRPLPDPTQPKRPRGRPRLRPLPDPSVTKRRRGRPRIRPLPDVSLPQRPRGRPRKAALAPTTSKHRL